MSLIVYLNGHFIEDSEAKISVFDSGFLYGDGIYESMRIYNHKITFLDEHYKRLSLSAKNLNYSMNLSYDEFSSVLIELVKRNKLKDAYVRVNITRGISNIGFGQSISNDQTVFIVAKPHKTMPDELYKNGVDLGIAETLRQKPIRDIQIKTISNTASLLAKLEVKTQNVYEVIMMNTTNHVTECAAANIFWIKSNKVFTPSVSTGILEGVTRKNVINICRNDLGLTVFEGEYRLDALLDADEVFVTSTSSEVMPVKIIKHTQDYDFSIGPLSKEIHIKFRERLK